jgi:hypothetical protein
MRRMLPDLRALPRFDAGLFLPGVMALGVYPLLMGLTGDQAASFITAFAMGLWVILARHGAWMARYWIKRFSQRVASLLAVCAALGPISVLMALGQAQWCLHLFSLYGLIACAVIVNDLRDGDPAYLRFRLPGLNANGAEVELTQALLVWNLCLIALNELFIASLGLSELMVWYAIFPVVVHVVEGAVVLLVLHRARMTA